MTTASPETVQVSIQDDQIILNGGGAQLRNRRTRLFLRSILGGHLNEEVWVIPARRRDPAEVVLQIYRWFEDRDATVELAGEAATVVSRQLELHRSVSRAREAGALEKGAGGQVDLSAAQSMLATIGWNADRFLRPHQVAGLGHALASANAANFSVPGSGKTTTALAAFGVHLAAGTVEFAVVVGPLSSFRPWENEAALAFGDAIGVRRVRGTAAQRHRILRSVRSKEILLLSYATATADVQLLREIFSSRPGLLVVDESHRIKRFEGGQWAPALASIASTAQVRMILSGTPMPNSAKDLYSQLNVLWPDEILTGTRGAFASRAEHDFGALIGDVDPFISRTPKSALGLGPYEVYRQAVPMGDLQSEVYELLENRFVQLIDDARSWAEKIEALRKARPVRLLQAASNPGTLNQRDSLMDLPPLVDAPRTLMERLQHYDGLERPAKHVEVVNLVHQLTRRGEKLVVWGTFLHNLDSLSRVLRRELGVPTYQVDGRVPLGDSPDSDLLGRRDNPRDRDSREDRIASFLACSGTAILVANPASCSESISLHSSCHNALYLDRTYDCALFLQSIDRIHRLGLAPETQVAVHILQSTIDDRPTIDHAVDASLRGKEAEMQRLLDGVELRPVDPSDPRQTGSALDYGDLELTLRYLLGQDMP